MCYYNLVIDKGCLMQFDIPSTINEMPTLVDFEKAVKGYELKLSLRIGLNAYWRSRMSEAQNHKCCWCGIETTDERDKNHSSTLEHVIPTSKGGANHPDNLAMACNKCNHKRGNKPAEQFIKELAQEKVTAEQLSSDSQDVPQRTIRQKQYQTLIFRLKALKAVLKCSENPFDSGTSCSKYYERYKKLDVHRNWYISTIKDVTGEINRKFLEYDPIELEAEYEV